MQSLKEKTINGVMWSATGNFAAMAVEFVVGIILARILSPKEFGLIGAIAVVIILSEVFVNSGFSQAIIRKQDCTQKDYSTAFFFNFFVAVLFFCILFFTAGPISIFLKNPELKPLIQVLGFGLIFSALTLIQSAKLSKRIDFKLQTKISLIASVTSGLIAIFLAIIGLGVWSLVIKTLINKALNSLMLWYWNKWIPDLVFCYKSFKELFGFGSKLLLSGLIGTFLNNVNYLIIAKYFSAQDVGYFTRAEMFKNLASQNISSVVTSVGYPVLASQQDNQAKLKLIFKEMFTNTFFIISLAMAGMAATSEAMILTLIGKQWLPSVVLLQMICFLGIMVPLNSMNINILNVVGRSDLYLKLQLVVQALSIPNIFIGIFFGIKALILGMIIISLVGYCIFNYQSNKVLKYPIKEQLKDIFPSFAISITMGLLVFLFGYFFDCVPFVKLTIQIALGIAIVIILCELVKLKEYLFIKSTLMQKVRCLKK